MQQVLKESPSLTTEAKTKMPGAPAARSCEVSATGSQEERLPSNNTTSGRFASAKASACAGSEVFPTTTISPARSSMDCKPRQYRGHWQTIRISIISPPPFVSTCKRARREPLSPSNGVVALSKKDNSNKGLFDSNRLRAWQDQRRFCPASSTLALLRRSPIFQDDLLCLLLFSFFLALHTVNFNHSLTCYLSHTQTCARHA